MADSTYVITCDHCGREAALSQPGRFCCARCRSYYHRDALLSQRRRLAARAAAALAAGDVAELERVARSAVALLAV